MKGFADYLKKNIHSGRISEIYDTAERYYHKPPQDLSAEKKLDILCAVMCITPEDLDEIIATHSEVARTIKGHAFEVVFDAMMNLNHIECTEVGGDSDIDRVIRNRTLQLKTPYVKGCSDGIVSYKTHKTHGAKSETESMDYYHKAEDFADYLVGLVSYKPFRVLIVPKEKLPRASHSSLHIESPMYLRDDDPRWLNRFSLLGIDDELCFPVDTLAPEAGECLPLSSKMLHLKSEYILRAVYIRDNFRIWDMNLRGFIREHIFQRILSENGIKVYPTNITGMERADKCDLVLKDKRGGYVRFQVKGLTWKGCKFKGPDTVIDCESQLSRGRVNDHPTRSRLYKDTDFEYLIIAVDPPYSNTLSIYTYGKEDYHWNFYCVPMSRLRKHPTYSHRVFSHQNISYRELQQYSVDTKWLRRWEKG